MLKVKAEGTETITGTAKQLCAAAGLADTGEKGYYNTTGILRFLEMLGVAKQIGSAPVVGTGKKGGKGATLWEIPKKIVIETDSLPVVTDTATHKPLDTGLAAK